MTAKVNQYYPFRYYISSIKKSTNSDYIYNVYKHNNAIRKSCKEKLIIKNNHRSVLKRRRKQHYKPLIDMQYLKHRR